MGLASLAKTGEQHKMLNKSIVRYFIFSPSSNITPWTFSSKRQDTTGLVYFGNRYYDPTTSTWLTQDPLGYTAGPNLYAYVNNNPLTQIDLYGLLEQETTVGTTTSESGSSSASESTRSETFGFTIPGGGFMLTGEMSPEADQILSGVMHGVADFVMDTIDFFVDVASYAAQTALGPDSSHIEDVQAMADNYEQCRENADRWIQEKFGYSDSDKMYQTV